MRFTVPFDDIATGVSDTYKTIAAIIAANTAGYRFRLRGLIVGPADDAPADLNFAVKIGRIPAYAGGTAGTAGNTIAAADMPHVDPDSIDSLMTAGRDYSAEPAPYATEDLFVGPANAHGTFIQEWEEQKAPVFIRNSLCGLRATSRTATAIRLSGTMEIEMF